MALSFFSDATVPLSQASQITGLALFLRTSSSLLDAALPCESLSLISSTVNSDLQQLSSKRAIVVTVPQPFVRYFGVAKLSLLHRSEAQKQIVLNQTDLFLKMCFEYMYPYHVSHN